MRKLTLTGLAAVSHENYKTVDVTKNEFYPLVLDIRKNCDLDIDTIDEVTRTTDDISEAIPYLFDRLIKEENPRYVLVLIESIRDKRYLHLLNIKQLITKYKTFNDTWVRNHQTGAKGQLARIISLMINKDDLDKIYDVFLNDESLGDTRAWFLQILNKYKANQKFYDYLVSHKDKYKDREVEYGIYANNMPYEENEIMNILINRFIISKKWKKFAEENKTITQ